MGHFRYCSKRARLWAHGFENDHIGCGTALVESAWHTQRVASSAVCGGEGSGVGPWWDEPTLGADGDVAPDDLQRGGATAAQRADVECAGGSDSPGRGGTISSERVEKPDDRGKFKVVNVSLDAVVPDPRALSDALYAMETQTPHLVVRELDARVKTYTQPRDLMVRLRVSGITGGK